MDRNNTTAAPYAGGGGGGVGGDDTSSLSSYDLLEADIAHLRLSASPSTSHYSPFISLPEDPFYSPSPSLPRNPPHPSSPLYAQFPSAPPAADPYHQFEPPTAPGSLPQSGGRRRHRIPADVVQLLNRDLLDGANECVALFFPVVLAEVTGLILDRDDFRVLARFVNACDELQKAELLAAAAADSRTLFLICRDKNGSAILETLIKYSRSQEQISRILCALRPYIVNLAKEKPGSDILKCCLSHPYFDGDKYMMRPIVENWYQLAIEKYGVFIVKEVVDHTTVDDAAKLLVKIAKEALELSQHPSGNYLVQHVLDKKIMLITSFVLSQLRGHLTSLSMQKYSSNVVENFLRNAMPRERNLIIRELLSSPNILEIMVHNYGNYVMQSAIENATGDVREELLHLVKKYQPILRNYGYYRKFIRKINEKNW